MERFYFVCILLLITGLDAFSQNNRAVQDQDKFEYITVGEGLANNRMNTICQHLKGFI